MASPDAVEHARRFLRPCRICGCSGHCGRMIDVRDGSVWPQRDTGYRHRPAQEYSGRG